MAKGRRAPSQRQLRVGEELRHALARILAQAKLNDPDLAGRPVTVCEVRIGPDLRNATVYVAPLGGGEAAALVAALNRAAAYFRGRVAAEVKLRHAPVLRFEADTALETALRIEALLREPGVARDLEAAKAGDDAQ